MTNCAAIGHFLMVRWARGGTAFGSRGSRGTRWGG